MSPSDTIQGRIEEAQRMRGWFVNSYAQIEFLLGAFLYEAYAHSEYEDLRCQIPHGIANRARKAEEIIAREGPLQVSGLFVEYLLPRFLKHEETRNLLAHGFCQYVFTKSGDWAIRYTKWHREKSKPGETLRMMRDFSLADFQRLLREIQDLAQETVINLGSLEQKFSTVHVGAPSGDQPPQKESAK